LGINVAFDFDFEIEKAEERDGNWYVEGYAATDDFDLQGDIITPEAIKLSEGDLLENSTVLENHDPNRRIGKVVKTTAEDDRLWIKVMISKTVPEIWQQIKEGVLNKFSIKGRILNAVKSFVPALQRVARIIKQMYLTECSLVSVPANPQAKVLRWSISKALDEFEKDGGQIPVMSEGGEQDDMSKQGKDEELKILLVKDEGGQSFETIPLDELIALVDEYADAEEDDDKKSKLQRIKSILTGLARGRAYPYPYAYPKPEKLEDSMTDEERKKLEEQLEQLRSENEKMKSDNEELKNTLDLVTQSMKDLNDLLDRYHLIPKEEKKPEA